MATFGFSILASILTAIIIKLVNLMSFYDDVINSNMIRKHKLLLKNMIRIDKDRKSLTSIKLEKVKSRLRVIIRLLPANLRKSGEISDLKLDESNNIKEIDNKKKNIDDKEEKERIIEENDQAYFNLYLKGIEEYNINNKDNKDNKDNNNNNKDIKDNKDNKDIRDNKKNKDLNKKIVKSVNINNLNNINLLNHNNYNFHNLNNENFDFLKLNSKISNDNDNILTNKIPNLIEIHKEKEKELNKNYNIIDDIDETNGPKLFKFEKIKRETNLIREDFLVPGNSFFDISNFNLLDIPEIKKFMYEIENFEINYIIDNYNPLKDKKNHNKNEIKPKNEEKYIIIDKKRTFPLYIKDRKNITCFYITIKKDIIKSKVKSYSISIFFKSIIILGLFIFINYMMVYYIHELVNSYGNSTFKVCILPVIYMFLINLFVVMNLQILLMAIILKYLGKKYVSVIKNPLKLKILFLALVDKRALVHFESIIFYQEYHKQLKFAVKS
jgi:hypothetical protein